MAIQPIAAVCGTCSGHRSVETEPDACFGCGARYGRGAPLLLVEVEITPHRRGNEITLDRAFRARFLGRWESAEIERWRAMLQEAGVA